VSIVRRAKIVRKIVRAWRVFRSKKKGLNGEKDEYNGGMGMKHSVISKIQTFEKHDFPRKVR
jgi:hypothetical protein